MRTGLLAVSNYELLIGVEFQTPPPSYDGVIEKTGRQVAKQASSLCRFWDLTGMGTSTEKEYPKAALLPGLGCLCLMLGVKEGWAREYKVSDAEKAPTDGNFSSQVCLSKYVEVSNGKHEFCTSQKWSYKRLSSYGLACGSWLYELSGTRPWLEGCIVSFQSETSQLHMFPYFEVLFTTLFSN